MKSMVQKFFHRFAQIEHSPEHKCRDLKLLRSGRDCLYRFGKGYFIIPLRHAIYAQSFAQNDV